CAISRSTYPDASTILSITNYPTGCKCPTDSSQLTGIPQNRCECLKTGDPRANGICPAYCVKGKVNASCECDINSSSFPLSNCEKEKLCITDLVHQPSSDCPCLSTGDPRAGNTCPAYCIKGQATANCTCNTNTPGYTVDQCQKEKLCITDLINQPNTTCQCLSTADPRAGNGQCPAYCIKDQVNESCVCDTNIPGYTQAQCQIEYQCKYNLASQSNATCPCLSTGDPRAGYGQCPAYCTSKDLPNQSCVCDSNPNSQYSLQTCQSEKKCNISSSSTVTKDSCTCSESNHPTGCRCPSETTQLTGIPVNYDESVGHLQPVGQFVLEHVHESFVTVEFELSLHFFSDQQVCGGYYEFEFESQTQLQLGQSFDVQQAGHYPFPALGSPVLKHGQVAFLDKHLQLLDQLLLNMDNLKLQESTGQLDRFVSHIQSDVAYPLIQYPGQVPLALGSLVLKHGHSSMGQ
ncbi:MAG: hypothetical protein EZS28_041820, partial [Streblomastix strix]